MKLWGKEFSKDALLKKVGDISQIGGVKLYELKEGNQKGVDAIDFRTAAGFNFTVLPGRGMDISYAEYRGIPLCWRSSTGDVASAYFEPEEKNWLRSFFGGLLTTCGLTYAGAACVDQGKKLGLHGRISNIPAKNVYADGRWEKDDYIFWAQGKVRETTVFGENICLERKILTKLGENKLFIEDKVENMGYSDTEHMILYHFNIGFPIVDAGSKLICPSVELKPRDREAEQDKENWSNFTSPVAGYKEKCYYHRMKPDKKGYVKASIENKKLKLGVYIKYIIDQLPYFTEWKMMGEGIYVVGMEPGNCLVKGRDKERKEGRLQFLKPGEIRKYRIEVGIEEIK